MSRRDILSTLSKSKKTKDEVIQTIKNSATVNTVSYAPRTPKYNFLMGGGYTPEKEANRHALTNNIYREAGNVQADLPAAKELYRQGDYDGAYNIFSRGVSEGRYSPQTASDAYTNMQKTTAQDPLYLKEMRMHGDEFYLDNDDANSVAEAMSRRDYKTASEIFDRGVSSGKYSYEIANATWNKLYGVQAQTNIEEDSTKAAELLANGDTEGAIAIFENGITLGHYGYDLANEYYGKIVEAQAEKDRLAARPYTVHEKNMHDKDEKDDSEFGLIRTMKEYIYAGDIDGLYGYINAEIEAGHITEKQARVNLDYATKGIAREEDLIQKLNKGNEDRNAAIVEQQKVVDDAYEYAKYADDEYYKAYSKWINTSNTTAEYVTYLKDRVDYWKKEKENAWNIYQTEKDELATMKGEAAIASADEYAVFSLDVIPTSIDAKIAVFETELESKKSRVDSLKREIHGIDKEISDINDRLETNGTNEDTQRLRTLYRKREEIYAEYITAQSEYDQYAGELYYLRGYKTFASLSSNERQAIMQYVAMGADVYGDYVDFYGQTRNAEEDWNNADWYNIITEIYAFMPEDDWDCMITTLETLRNAKIAAVDYADSVEFANAHPVLAALLAIPGGLFGGISSTLTEVGRQIGNMFSEDEFDKPYDKYAPGHRLSNATDATVGQIYSNIDREYGEGAAFLYGTTHSMGQNIAAAAIPFVGPAILASQAYSESYRSAKDRGLSDSAANETAIASAAFEFIFESISFGKIKAFKAIPATDLKTVLVNTFKSVGVNASEEFFTEVANIVFDELHNGDLSEFSVMYQQYLDSGMSPEAAKSKLQGEFWSRTGQASASGAIMGGVMTSVGSTTDYIKNGQSYNEYGSFYFNDDGTLNTVLADLLIYEASNSKNKDVKNYAKTLLKRGDNVTQNELGALHMMYYSSLSQEQSENAPAQDVTPNASNTEAQTTPTATPMVEAPTATASGVAPLVTTAPTATQTASVRDSMSDKAKTAYDNALETATDKETAAKEFEASYLRGFNNQPYVEDGTALATVMQKIAYEHGAVDRGRLIAKERGVAVQTAETETTATEYTPDAKAALDIALKDATDQDAAAREFEIAYRKGLNGMDFKADPNAELTVAMQNAAYAYGLEASVDITAEVGKVKFAADVKPTKGFARTVEKFARATNTGITIGGNAPVNEKGIQKRGWYLDGKDRIHIYSDVEVTVNTFEGGKSGLRTLKGEEAAMMVILGHEMTHRLKTLSPELYAKFEDYVLSKGGRAEAERRMNEYDLSDAVAKEETVADYAMMFLFSDAKTVREITRTDPTFAQKIREFFNWILHKLGLDGEKNLSEEDLNRKRMIEHSAKLWNDAYRDSVANAKNGITKATKITNKSGEVVVETDGNGGVRFSESTYEDEGKRYLTEWLDEAVARKDIDRADADSIIKELDTIYQVMQQFHGKYSSYDGWRIAEVIRDEDGNPLLSVVKENGEYAMNLDFSLVCKKRRALDAVFGEMIRRGTIGNFNLNEQGIATINNIIKKHGLEIACDLCFVDAKRYRQGRVADQFSDMYNNLVKSLVKDKSKISSFNFATGETSEGITTMDDSELNFAKIDKILKAGNEKTVAYGIAKLLKENPESRKFVSRADFMNSDGFAAVKRTAPEVLKLYNKKKGSGGPKASFSDVQYMNDVLKDNRFYADAAYAVGGVRIQSFSDYIAKLVFDYAQEVADLSAKKLPAHSYTKEALFAKQFGLTGIKINLSLIPKIVDGGVAPGLDANGNYAWADESFDFDMAVEIENAEGYKENCGTIAVGVSKAHIEKMLGDDNIRMIIPYHKSSLNPVVAEMRNIKGYTDYTSKQNTRDKNTGKKLTSVQKKSEPNFNELLKKHGNPKAAADAYLEWCDENNYIPKFDEFAGHDNYYKLLTDFAVYDADGNYHPQGAVTMTFPDADSAFGDMVSLIESGLAEDQKNADALTSELSSIVDEIEATLPLNNADFEMKRTGLGLSLNMPFSKVEAPAETKNTAEGGVRYSTSGDEVHLFASMQGQREIWNRVQKMTPMQIANMQLEDIDPLPKRQPSKPSGINAENGKESKFYDSAMKSDNVADDTKALLKNIDDVKYYAGVANEETLNEANDRLNLNGQTETMRFFALNPEFASAVDVAEGFILLKRYQDKGDFETATEVARKLREIGTKSGQTTQAFSILGRFTPEGMAVYAQKELDQAREEMIRKHSEAWVEQRKDMFKLTEEEMELIKRNMEAASKLPDCREKTILIAQIATMLEEKLPKKVLKQIQAYTRIAMLLNPKTQIRNVIGNTIMLPVYAIEDVIGTALDKGLALRSGVRTKGIAVDLEGIKAFAKGMYKSFDDFRRHVNTRDMSGDRFEIGGGDAFRWYGKKEFKNAKGIGRVKYIGYTMSDILNAVDRINSFLLDFGDRPFFEMHFTNSINNQMRLNKVTEPTADMVRIATGEALQRTWQDNNKYTEAVTRIRDILNGGKNWGIGSIIIPFAKTPANLTKALVDYSPVGLAKAITYDAYKFAQDQNNKHPDPMKQHRFVTDFSKGVTGTLLYLVAMELAKHGIISGGDDEEDKDLAAFKKYILGIAPYSVKIGGKSYSYDWAQPIGGIMAIAADLEQNKNKSLSVKGLDAAEGYGKSILNALSAGGNVLFEQSFLQGVAELFGDDGLMGGLISSIAGTPTQFTPTALSQIAQLSDPYLRTSYGYNDIAGTAANKVKAKIPGQREELAPVVDVLGHEVLAYGGDNGIVNVFFNPANIYSSTANDVANEIYRVYEQTGDVTIIPRVAPYYITYKEEKYEFTPHERAEYQRTMGGANERIVYDLLQNENYSKLTDKEKAMALTLVTDYATSNAKYVYLTDHDVEFERESWVANATDAPVSEATFILAKVSLKKVDQPTESGRYGTYTNEEIGDAIMQIDGLSKAEKEYLWVALGGSEKSIPRYWKKRGGKWR